MPPPPPSFFFILLLLLLTAFSRCRRRCPVCAPPGWPSSRAASRAAGRGHCPSVGVKHSNRPVDLTYEGTDVRLAWRPGQSRQGIVLQHASSNSHSTHDREREREQKWKGAKQSPGSGKEMKHGNKPPHSRSFLCFFPSLFFFHLLYLLFSVPRVSTWTRRSRHFRCLRPKSLLREIFNKLFVPRLPNC